MAEEFGHDSFDHLKEKTIEGGGGGQGEEMTQTMYVHVNK
jgi:hypothetical protein